jgi:UDP-N-acetylmuramoyl-tripeptide--D-alanyl-D-alanine ligase
MRDWDAGRVAEGASALLARNRADQDGPSRVVIDSREAGPGVLFVGLPGERVDGGTFAADVLEAGAWGVLVAQEHAATDLPGDGAVLSVPDPLLALGALARSWRRELGSTVIGVTGSVGKTSTKDLLAALIAPHRSVAASRANFNTEIGLPLELLAAPAGTEVLVLELAMRGAGQIAELAAICEPDVGVITNIGPVHLELLGSIEAIAATKAELVEGLGAEGVAVLPAQEPLLDRWRGVRETVTFGADGDVALDGDTVIAHGERLDLELPFTAAHQRSNALAAVAAALAAGVHPGGRLEVAFSALRGERVELGGGAVVINDCYNANPLSMRAALDDLALQESEGRRMAVLGDMLELGPDEVALHREIGAHASASGVDVLVTVGPLALAMTEAFEGETYAVGDAAEAAALLPELVGSGDVVLVKASRGVGLEVVTEALVDADG